MAVTITNMQVKDSGGTARDIPVYNRNGVWFPVMMGYPNTICHGARNTAAQSNIALVSASGTERVAISRLQVAASNANTVDVDFHCGFHATTLATPGTGTGTADILADFMAIPPGGSMVVGDGFGIVGISPALGDDFRYTHSVPTTGHFTVTVSYFILVD